MTNASSARTVLITGASTGIGYELARLFAADKRQDWELVLLARRAPRMKDVADRLASEFGVRTHALSIDLSEAHGPHEAWNQVRQLGLKLDCLVNNAGFGTSGPFASLEMKEQLALIQLNVTSLVHLTKLFLQQIVARKGRVLNVASTAAFQPGPNMAVYYASKAFVLSFSEAIAEEMRGAGVRVSTLCPGPTLTEFQRRAQMSESALFKGPFTMDAPTVARAGFEGLMRGKRLIIPGWQNKLMIQSERLAPRNLVMKISAAVTKKL
ncbi:MAG TPA: SDR family oxidoreductase [Clostridia bacterium]|nr:SDR family oxidoreductase [Clostridia bacterium]